MDFISELKERFKDNECFWLSNRFCERSGIDLEGGANYIAKELGRTYKMHEDAVEFRKIVDGKLCKKVGGCFRHPVDETFFCEKHRPSMS